MRRSRRWLRIPLLLLVLSAGYVASVGPASAYADRHPILRDNLGYYYAPLIIVARQTPLGGPLKAYEQWWRDSFR